MIRLPEQIVDLGKDHGGPAISIARLSCVTSTIVIGETSLAVQCTQLLKKRGHSLAATCGNADAPLKSWAETEGIPYFSGLAELESFAAGASPDYLFSVVNYRILPPGLLRAAKLAINYHDGPLPRYAGVYATSWAILNGETQHGITWHVMLEKLAAGDILVQRPVPISPDDTAHTLNLKCHLGAYRAFAALVPQLESGSLSRTPQDLRERTYYGRSKWSSTRLSWDWPAGRIDRFCRALAFHPERNPIGASAAELNGLSVHVGAATPCDASGKPRGTIGDVADDYVQVATAEGDVRLRNLRQTNGEPVDLAAFKEKLTQRQY